jgi:N-methylhydantoinase B
VVVPSKCDHVKVRRGDVLHYVTWGGGGWGDPLERAPEAVQKDARRGLVSLEGARRNYGVVLGGEEKGWEVDAKATAALREEMRRVRGEPPLFNFGFRTGLKATEEEIQALRKSCQQETGLAAPASPSELLNDD